MRRRHSRDMTEAEISRITSETREMARQHPLVIPRKVGEYVNLIVQGCTMQDTYLVDLGHVCLQALGLELAEMLVDQLRQERWEASWQLEGDVE